ncbi:MAG: hypothetical protein JXR73_11240 [Candidatus Omnitrophica bacterium]|nr:hypothetical protein [Candidatus Omnitrophota bacterium]
MVRGKKSRKSGLPVNTQTETQIADAAIDEFEAKPRSSTFAGKRFSLLDYAVVCLFFIAFCFVQKFVALTWFGVKSAGESIALEELSLTFFFGTMWKGFIIVAILAWLYDLFYHDREEADTA